MVQDPPLQIMDGDIRRGSAVSILGLALQQSGEFWLQTGHGGTQTQGDRFKLSSALLHCGPTSTGDLTFYVRR